MRIVYKIVNFFPSKNQITTLYKSYKGSKVLSLNKWLKAERKLGRESNNKKRYLTGFHCLLSLRDCKDYLKKFRNKKNRIIICAQAKVLQPKPTNKKVFLAKWLRICEIKNYD